MKTIDLSHTISTDMPVYPGTSQPKFSIPCTIEKSGFTERELTMFSHTGTHIDAPAHILPYGKSLDQFSTDRFMGKASVIDLTNVDTLKITYQDLLIYEPMIKKSDFIIFNTGWYQKWGKDDYFLNYPVLTAEAAKWLAAFSIKGIGVDMISVDQTSTNSFPIHRYFLEKDIIIIENLTNLDRLGNVDFSFICLPLKIQNADGSPTRAAALIK